MIKMGGEQHRKKKMPCAVAFNYHLAHCSAMVAQQNSGLLVSVQIRAMETIFNDGELAR